MKYGPYIMILFMVVVAGLLHAAINAPENEALMELRHGVRVVEPPPGVEPQYGCLPSDTSLVIIPSSTPLVIIPNCSFVKP